MRSRGRWRGSTIDCAGWPEFFVGDYVRHNDGWTGRVKNVDNTQPHMLVVFLDGHPKLQYEGQRAQHLARKHFTLLPYRTNRIISMHAYEEGEKTESLGECLWSKAATCRHCGELHAHPCHLFNLIYKPLQYVATPLTQLIQGSL